MRIESGSRPSPVRIENPESGTRPPANGEGLRTPGLAPRFGPDGFARVRPGLARPPAPSVPAAPGPPSALQFRVLGNALVPSAVAPGACGVPAGVGLRPEVEEAIQEIEAYAPALQAGVLPDLLDGHAGDVPDDVEFREQLLQGLGPDRVGEMLSSAAPIDGIYSRGHDFRGVLAAAASVYAPEDLGVLVERLGSEQLARMVALGVYEGGRPDQDPARTEQIRAELLAVARLLGSVYALPDGAAGKAELKDALDRLRGGDEPLLDRMPGEEVAAWVVARSDEDTLKLDFALSYLADFRADPSSLSPTEARSVALVLGSLEPPSLALRPIVGSLDAQQRRSFLSTMMEATYGQTPEWQTPYLFNRDIAQGVTAFMMDVARLNPVTFEDPDAAQDFRVEAFRAGTRGLDNDLFEGEQAFKDALANMFVADTAGIVHDLSDSGGANWDVEGRDLARFLDHVAFRNEGASRRWVIDAMKAYLGTGEAEGVADVLAANKGNPDFMSREGNRMAREMGFLLGALNQGAGQALREIDGELARQRAVIDVIGGIAETVIEASPAAAAYKLVKQGSGGKVEVETVFDWLAETYLGREVRTSKDNVTRLSGSLISNVWAAFFSDDSLAGARSEDLVNLYSLINAGVALADGTEQPSIRIGG